MLLKDTCFSCDACGNFAPSPLCTARITPTDWARAVLDAISVHFVSISSRNPLRKSFLRTRLVAFGRARVSTSRRAHELHSAVIFDAGIGRRLSSVVCRLLVVSWGAAAGPRSCLGVARRDVCSGHIDDCGPRYRFDRTRDQT
jgi:hypothetical protein